MDTDAKGQVGGIDTDESVKKRLAKESISFKCATCGRSNEQIMKERQEAVKEMGEMKNTKNEEDVPAELRLAYREDLAQGEASKAQQSSTPTPTATTPSQPRPPSQPASVASTSQIQQPLEPATVAPLAPQQIARANNDVPGWIDKAIYGVAIALILMILRQFS